MESPKHHRVRPSRTLGLPVLVALLLAGCGGSSGSPSATTSQTIPPAAPATTPAAPATTHTTQATDPATPPAATTASTAEAAIPPCRAAGLSLVFLGGEGAAGHGELGFELRNTSSQACTTIGYPGIQFLDQSGGALPTVPTHTTEDFFGSVSKLPLTIAPGATASFRLGVTHGAASPVGCATAYGLQVIPPNDTATLRISIPSGAYECQTATVSPLAKGTSAYSGPGPTP